jgi:hypothetical protein
MSPMVGELHYRSLRAPQGDGETLIDPPASRFGELLEQNTATIERYDFDLQGRGLARIVREARSQLIDAALSATRQYRDVDAQAAQAPAAPILLAGHQPQLFHPGVWYKNFVLSRLAREHRAVAINLVIDSDTTKDPAIRVPTGTVTDPRVESVAFDRPTAEMPFEERSIQDAECWRRFGSRVQDHIRSLVPNPLIEEFWPRVVERSRFTSRTGDCLSQARHQQEGVWGAQTLELPQSRVCQLESFHWFTAHLLAHLPRLWDVYNSSVAEFRRINHVRSTAHPVPNLIAQDDWLEAPFWVWSTESPRRSRLFVRPSGDELVLSNRRNIEVRLPLSPDADAAGAVSKLGQLSGQGIKLRTRALITTMFARLILGDMFLHGIGGAKYDQLTDALIQRFFGLEPPSYMTVTATLRLPVALPPESPRLRDIDAQLRDLTYHPESFLEGTAATAEVANALAAKRHWIEIEQTVENAKTRCRAIRAANESLQPLLAHTRQALLAEREVAFERARRRAILASREYAFVLFPAEQLRSLFTAPLV